MIVTLSLFLSLFLFCLFLSSLAASFSTMIYGHSPRLALSRGSSLIYSIAPLDGKPVVNIYTGYTHDAIVVIKSLVGVRCIYTVGPLIRHIESKGAHAPLTSAVKSLGPATTKSFRAGGEVGKKRKNNFQR